VLTFNTTHHERFEVAKEKTNDLNRAINKLDYAGSFYAEQLEKETNGEVVVLQKQKEETFFNSTLLYFTQY